MTVALHKMTEYSCARDALAELCRGIPGFDPPDGAAVQAHEIVQPWHRLLCHHRHMTEVLGRHYGRPVELHALECVHEGDAYTRKLLLTLEGTDRVVQLAAMRMDFRYVSAEVRAEVVGRAAPLGAILIRHNVLRRIEPRWYLRFPAHESVLEQFGVTLNAPSFGRIGTIYCNEEPAIEVLEIVVDTMRNSKSGARNLK